MEVQYIMSHNPYDLNIKNEIPGSPPKKSGCHSSSDMLFSNFHLPPAAFCGQIDTMNNNHGKFHNGRSMVTTDRKRPYPCDQCQSRFGSKMELEEHQNSHTGQKPFECEICKTRFNRRSTLWNHKRIHSEAKPFECSVCHMTFKWKNSLKCHKEMHLRKNEASGHIDNDLRQLTYATAAKKQKAQEGEENGGGPGVLNQPLITTTPKKKTQKANRTSESLASLLHQNNFFDSKNFQSLSSHSHLGALQQPLQASSLIPPSDHPLDLDTSSLDTLVSSNHSNLLLQMDMENGLAPRDATSMLSGLDEQSMLGSQLLGDLKSESPMGGATAPINVHLNMQFPVFNIRPLNAQQLPSVHHLTSTSLPSVSVDYSNLSDSNISSQPYIVTSQPDMMQNMQYQQPLDQCVILATGQEYLPNFDYQMISGNYNMVEPQQDQNQHQNNQQGCGDEKILPYDQW